MRFAITSPNQAGIHAATGAATGGINASITGGDIGIGMLTGAISAGAGKFAGVKYLQSKSVAVQFAGYSSVGAVTGGITYTMYGGDFGNGFVYGFQISAYGFWFNQMGIAEGVGVAVWSGLRGGAYSFWQATKSMGYIWKEGGTLPRVAMGIAGASLASPLAAKAAAGASAVYKFSLTISPKVYGYSYLAISRTMRGLPPFPAARAARREMSYRLKEYFGYHD